MSVGFRAGRALIGLVGAGLIVLLAVPARAQDEPALTPKQQDAVRKLIHDYLMENPAIVAEAIDALREKEELAAENAGRKALLERREDIINDADSPVLGTLKADITLVEFFDYRSPYARAMSDMVFEVVDDKKVRYVMKELPLLGPDSIVAARAALAARSQGLGTKFYAEFHKALMHLKGPMTEGAILKLAADLKLDVKRLKKDMDDPHTDEILKRNLQLARALDITETPTFIIGDQMVSSTMSRESLIQLIDQARKPKG